MNDETPPPAALSAALDYAARGLSVLPLCPPDHVGVGKAHRGCKSAGKVPFFPNRPDGSQGEWKAQQVTPLTADELRAVWDYHPRLNVGAALGPVSRLAGVDVDDEDGEDLLREMAAGDLPPTWEYTTGKGRRLLYRLPDGVGVRTVSYTRPGTEIEILRLMGRGGQVVLPPSVHMNGSTYRWAEGRSPADMPEPAEVPAWMRAENLPDDRRPAPADGELIGEGGRDNYLTSVAGAMRKRGCHEEAILAALDVMNRSRCDPPLADADLARIARSVSRYEPDAFTGVSLVLPDPTRVPVVPPGEQRFKWAMQLTCPPKADDWIWNGYLPRAGITLLSALWKAGKTTLLAHMLKALAEKGTFLGRETKAAKVLYVSEEGERHWVRRRDDIGFGTEGRPDHVGFYLQPFPTKPDPAGWLGFIGQLVADVKQHKFDLVVFDTLAKLWPVREENDAGSVDAALMPLWELTKAGAGVLLIHHLRKSGGMEFTGSRGSGALSAFPDIVVELLRFDAKDPKCRMRKMTAKGRYDETPDELVIELGTNGYRALGEEEVAALEADDDKPARAAGGKPASEASSDDPPLSGLSNEQLSIFTVMSRVADPWMTIEAIRDGLRIIGKGTRNEDLNANLASLSDSGQVVERGKLRSKKNPQQYALARRARSRSAPVSDGNEMRERDAADGRVGDVGHLVPASRSHETQGRNEMPDAGDGGRCRGCGAAATQVHHLTYERVGREELADLASVCGDCHERLHAK